MRRAALGFLVGLSAALMLGAAGSSVGSRPAQEAITVTQGDTLRTYYSIAKDSVLTGGHQFAVAAKCGIGTLFMRLYVNGKFVSGDTVAVTVTGCAPVDSAPASAAIWSDEGGAMHLFAGSSGPVNGPPFCLYVVERTRSGLILTGHKIKSWHVADPTLLRAPSLSGPCPDTTVNPAQVTVYAPAPGAPPAFERVASRSR